MKMEDCGGNFLIVPTELEQCRRKSETDLTLLPLAQSRRKSSSFRNLVQAFDSRAGEHIENQKLNPFSDKFDKNYRPALSKQEYGRPKPGSKSEARSIEALAKTYDEVRNICEVIEQFGVPISRQYLGIPQGAKKVVKFITVFELYSNVSGNLNGLLINARKRGMITFEGEMLYQGASNDVDIYMLKTIEEIREYCNEKASEQRRSVTPQPY